MQEDQTMNNHSSCHHNPTHDHGDDHAHPAQLAALKDPVCGMSVSEDSAHNVHHLGEDYYFCSAGCRNKFVDNPDKYLHSTEEPVGDSYTWYTCPMHPEVRQTGPATCPKCGMALEPEMPALDDAEDPELVDFRRRFWVSVPFTLSVFALAMFGHGWLPMGWHNWVELLLATPVVLWSGLPFFVRGALSIANRSPNMWTLIGLGTAAAYIYSVIATIVPGIFPTAFFMGGKVNVYFEAAAVIISLTLMGQLFELKARSRTSEAIKSLLRLAPDIARRINPDGSETDVPLADVQAGDHLR